MADSKSNTAGGGTPLNPKAASFTMPAAAENNPSNGTAPSIESTIVNGTSEARASRNSDPRPEAAPRTTAEQNVAEAGAGVKLTGAELKRQKAAQKAARRADKVAAKGEPAAAQAEAQSQAQAGATSAKSESQRRPSTTKRESDTTSHHKRTPSGKGIPIRGGPQQQSQNMVVEKEKRPEVKRVPIFSHLYPKEKKATLSGAGREIHPAVISLGLQLRDYVICGGNARCVATLLTFKKVIQAYTTPPGVALSRHLLTHLNHQIAYLRNARPLSMSQGNSIRWLKNLISTQSVDATDSQAKRSLCMAIDLFVRERITLADEVIAREASARVEDRDVIVTYAKSSIVEKTLLTAHRRGKSFTVIVVDSRPMFEGRNLARSLIRAGLNVQYTLLSGLGDILSNNPLPVTKCFLGASAMLGNGSLLSRAGSAMVAMMAKECGPSKARVVPVIVLCETVKFTAKAALDSIILNEVGDADALVETEESDILSTPKPAPDAANAPNKGGSTKKSNSSQKDKDDDDADEKGASKATGLEGWKDQPNLFLLNLMYDVTPATFIDLVVCELGSLPPSAVPVVNGVHGDDQALA